MYNKIAPIILNSSKAQGVGAVYISQPDAEKENLAGKLFLLAEVQGKKSDLEKIISFLITDLEENYYQDEKILLIGKMEGLKPESIFEASLAKTNKNLTEFLKDHKIQLDPKNTNITLGVVCGDKLHFSSFGNNKSLLIYRREDGFEIINVDTGAKDTDSKKDKTTSSKSKGLFASVLSGEIPLGSYFIFASESLPEYLSSRDLVKIVTKLPPIVAAEQIKNILAKINNYVPFLGVIIKNTTDRFGGEIKESIPQEVTAHNSISSLNRTEENTESMLSPAGLISFSRIGRVFNSILPKKSNKQAKSQRNNKEYLRKEDDSPELRSKKSKKEKLLNLPSASSFLSPQKVMLKKGSRHFFTGVAQFFKFLPVLFSINFWKNLFHNIKNWFKSLNKKSIFIFAGLAIIVIAFVVNLIIVNNKKEKQAVIDSFNQTVAQIEEKGSLIDSHLLYDNKDGANRVLSDIEELIADLPQEEEYQIEAYNRLSKQIDTWEDEIWDINRVSNIEQIASFDGAKLIAINYADNQFYGNSQNNIYTLNTSDNNYEEIEFEEEANLNKGRWDDENQIFYQDDENIYTLNIENQTVDSDTLTDYDVNKSHGNFDLYNDSVYLISQTDSQLYVYPASLNSRRAWLDEEAGLINTVDLYIDGSIYFLDNNGLVRKYLRGESENYDSSPLVPETSNATKILGDDNNLYILDNGNRIAVLEKESGELIAQYIFSNLSNIDDFNVNPSENLIYILENDILYQFELELN